MHVTYLVKLAGVWGSFWVQEIRISTNICVPPSLLFLPYVYLTAAHLSLLCLFSLKITGLNYAFNLHFFEGLHLLVSPFNSDPEATDAPSYLCICLLGQVIKVVFLLPTLHLLNVTWRFGVGMVLLNLVSHWHSWNHCHLLTLPFPLLPPLVMGWRGELEA